MKKLISFSGFSFYFLVLFLSLVLSACGESCQKKNSDNKIAGGNTANRDAFLEALKWVPDHQDVLLSLNKKAFDQSLLAKELNKKIPQNMQVFLQEVNHLVLALGEVDLGKPKHFLMIVDTSIKKEALLSESKKAGEIVKESSYQGVTLYHYEGQDKRSLAYFKDYLLVGEEASIQGAIDLAAGKGKSVTSNQKIMALLESMDLNRTLAVVGVFPPELQASAGGPGKAAQSLDLVGDFDQGLDLKAKIAFENAEQAKELEGMAQLYKGVFSAQKPEIALVLEKLQVLVEGSSLHLNLKLEEAALEKLLSQASAESK